MRSKQFTQHQKILGLMIARKDQQEWFFPYDFMPPRVTLDYIYCVGYEATARFAELGKRYPDMLDSQPAGKYKKRRIRWEAMGQWLPQLPSDLRYMFHRGGLTKDLPKPEPVEAPRQAVEPTPVADIAGSDRFKFTKPTPPQQGQLFDLPPKPRRYNG